jgi:ABC-2 type transport system ATP-binding protein
MADSWAIFTQGLTKSYGNIKALRGVDLQVQTGEIFGFLGPNGAGKTTTIRCLLDQIRPDSGLVKVLGLDPQADPVAVHERVGYLPGELHLDDHFTVEAVLKFLNHLRGNGAEWGYVRQLAARLDLNLKTPVKNLSKGNKQKVGVIQALMHRPDLLLLDEPTVGLDPLMQQEVLRLIVDARSQGATIFFSSHILSEVQEIASRVAIIRQGVVVEVAQPSELITRSMHRAHIQFGQPLDWAIFESLPGVKVLSYDDNPDRAGASLTVQIEGEMDGLIKALAAFPVSEFETERPTLEEIFLAYYETKQQG